MSSIGKAVGRLLGVPKAPKVKTVLEAAKDEKPTVMPVEGDTNSRAAVLEMEKKARTKKGRAYTINPGRSLGSAPTMLG
jgi:hypothetical protein